METGEGIGESELLDLTKTLNIPQEDIFWSIGTKKEPLEIFSFPVLSRSGAIVDASRYSKISVPSAAKNWVYIGSNYEKALREKLDNR